MTTNPAEILSDAIGAEQVLTGEALAARNPGYCEESLGAQVLVRPRNTQDLVTICQTAAANKIALVPHGGLTGLVDATASHMGEVIVSFERMNRVLRIDPAQGIAVVEPGVTLEALADALSKHDVICGVDIPSRGSCTLGGMVSTNAGGARVLRYGMMRQNVLGLEVVLANGQVLDMTSPLLKNNAGYDLKQLFIGSEGTLGLVTKIVLRLWPAPKSLSCALVACDSFDHFSQLFEKARHVLGARLMSFEAMWPDYYRLTTSQPGFGAPPLGADHGLYGVVEVSEEDEESAQNALMSLMEPAFEAGLVADAIVAQSEAERATIWRAREDSDAIEHLYETYLSYDVGFELRDLGPFATALVDNFAARFPEVTPYIFGHVGDGNLHVMYGLSHSEAANRDVYDALLYDTVSGFAGSTVSAEHGIGLEKRAYLDRSITPQMLDVMKSLKRTLDPDNILNPGKIFEL